MGLATLFFELLRKYYGDKFIPTESWLIRRTETPDAVILEITPPFKHVTRPYENGDQLFRDKLCYIISGYISIGVKDIHLVFDNFSTPNKGAEHEKRREKCEQLTYPATVDEFKALVVETHRSRSALENAGSPEGVWRSPPIVSDYTMVNKGSWEQIMNNETFKGVLCRYLSSKILMNPADVQALDASDVFISTKADALIKRLDERRLSSDVASGDSLEALEVMLRAEIEKSARLSLPPGTKIWLHGAVCKMSADGTKGVKDGRVFLVQRHDKPVHSVTDVHGETHDVYGTVEESSAFYSPSVGRHLGEGEISCAYILCKLLESWETQAKLNKRIKSVIVDSVDGDLIFILLRLIQSFKERSLGSSLSTPGVVLRLSMSGKKLDPSFEDAFEERKFNPVQSAAASDAQRYYDKLMARDESGYGARDWADARTEKYNFSDSQNKGYPPRFESVKTEMSDSDGDDDDMLAKDVWNRPTVRQPAQAAAAPFFKPNSSSRTPEDVQFGMVLKKLHNSSTAVSFSEDAPEIYGGNTLNLPPKRTTSASDEEREFEDRLAVFAVDARQFQRKSAIESKMTSGTVVDIGQLYDELRSVPFGGRLDDSPFTGCKDPVATMILVSSLMKNDFIKGFAPGCGSDSDGTPFFFLPLIRGTEFKAMAWIENHKSDSGSGGFRFAGSRPVRSAFDLALPKSAHLTVKAHIDENLFVKYVEYCYFYKHGKVKKVELLAQKKYADKLAYLQRNWVKCGIDPSNKAQLINKSNEARKECYIDAIREHLSTSKARAMMSRAQILGYAARLKWLMEYWTIGPLDDAKIPHPCAVWDNGLSIYGWKMEKRRVNESGAFPEFPEDGVDSSTFASKQHMLKMLDRCVYTDDVCDRVTIDCDFDRYVKLRLVDVNGASLKLKNEKKQDTLAATTFTGLQQGVFGDSGWTPQTEDADLVEPAVSSNPLTMEKLESRLDSQKMHESRQKMTSILDRLHMTVKQPADVETPLHVSGFAKKRPHAALDIGDDAITKRAKLGGATDDNERYDTNGEVQPTNLDYIISDLAADPGGTARKSAPKAKTQRSQPKTRGSDARRGRKRRDKA